MSVSRTRKNRAFTLIELLVVISIISVLSSVVLASLNTARDNARIGAAKSMASQIDRVEGDQAVAIWRFNENSGTTVADESRNGNTLTLTNGAAWSPDTPFNVGYSVSLNGTTQYVMAVDSVSLDIGTNDLTIVGWVKTSAASNQRIVSKRGGALGAGYSLVIAAGGVPYVEILSATGSRTATAPTAVNDGKWHFVAGIINRAGNAVACVDGKCGTPVDFSSMSAVDLSNSFNCDVGVITPGSSGYLAGLIDEVRIFTKVFTAEDVSKLYAADLENMKSINVALSR